MVVRTLDCMYVVSRIWAHRSRQGTAEAVSPAIAEQNRYAGAVFRKCESALPSLQDLASCFGC